MEELCDALYALYEDWSANPDSKATASQAALVLNHRQTLINEHWSANPDALGTEPKRLLPKSQLVRCPDCGVARHGIPGLACPNKDEHGPCTGTLEGLCTSST